MADLIIKPFLCEAIEKSSLRIEWEKWLRAFEIYLESEDIVSVRQKKNKLLHLAGTQVQSVAYSLPGAIEAYNETAKNDVYQVLVDKLNAHFSPKQNSIFETHLFRTICRTEGETFAKFVLKLRQQINKCSFGTTKHEIEEICLKDKIIDAWASKELKKKLLEKERTLDEVIAACQVDEQINQQSETMISDTDGISSVNKVKYQARASFAQGSECGRCGQNSHADNSSLCPAKLIKCNKCGRVGHFARKCRTNLKRHSTQSNLKNSKRKYDNIRLVSDDGCDADKPKLESHCFNILSDDEEETIQVKIGGHSISVIIDSGSRFNLVSQTDWLHLQKAKATLFNVRSNTHNQFRSYASDQLLKVMCVFEAPISVDNNPEMIASFFVIENGEQSLLGRETAIKLNVLRLGSNLNHIEPLKPFPKWKEVVIKLSINPEIKPVQQPMRRIPVALEEKVLAKLDEALSLDVIEPVIGHSPWISPMVLAFKENGDIRICLDMRLANRAILRENYPLPTFESFMTKLRNAKFFSRLDLKDAYHQLELHENSREITTFITPRGLFRYKRLMFGINSAPEIFQRRLEQLLSPCSNVMNYIDDVIIFGSDEKEHDKNVNEVCEIFKANNVLLNHQKCIWKTNKLKFLGHILSDKGIEVDPEKITTITTFRDPVTKEEVRSFLGLVTYVGKFIPDLATRTEPLRRLLIKENNFCVGHGREEGI
ncbi:uncharacterized protein K02A2.6-like [Anastrepha obliqua]|uniref:uncharacterized protein K02A2.6-like n=1 Tax=Anastrepha obliqua TaxID=95512 RepID=UPI002409585A|nr:uncharacterized protein K02A2.6-like [Anastrepha obliqua]